MVFKAYSFWQCDLRHPVFQNTTRKATINLDEPSLSSIMQYEEDEDEEEGSLEATAVKG